MDFGFPDIFISREVLKLTLLSSFSLFVCLSVCLCEWILFSEVSMEEELLKFFASLLFTYVLFFTVSYFYHFLFFKTSQMEMSFPVQALAYEIALSIPHLTQPTGNSSRLYSIVPEAELF